MVHVRKVSFTYLVAFPSTLTNALLGQFQTIGPLEEKLFLPNSVLVYLIVRTGHLPLDSVKVKEGIINLLKLKFCALMCNTYFNSNKTYMYNT